MGGIAFDPLKYYVDQKKVVHLVLVVTKEKELIFLKINNDNGR